MGSRFIIVCAVVVLAACGKTVMYNISGTWEGGDGEYVRITRTLEEKQQQTIDSALVENGRFHMVKPFDGTEEVTFRAGKVSIPFLLEEAPVVVTCTATETEYKGRIIPQLQVKLRGSTEQDIYREFLNAQRSEMLLMLGLAFMNKNEGTSRAEIDSVANFYVETQGRNKLLYDSLVLNNPDRVASAIIINDRHKSWCIEKTEKMYGMLSRQVRESAPGKKVGEAIATMKSISPGAVAPDFTLHGPDGESVKLSDFRGRYVLLDFWASWCGPCLREAPNVKKVYDLYHDRGFEILGISLDENADAWKKAIDSHRLDWRHASSLKGWACPVAQKYNVSGIPAMFLIDPDGHIIDSGLRGGALEDKISAIFENEMGR